MLALVMAMETEALPLIESLRLEETRAPLGFRFFQGKLANGRSLFLSLAGRDAREGVDRIGTTWAALQAYETLRVSRAEICVNAGTAGGFLAHGGSVGGIYLSHGEVRFHDRHIALAPFDRYALGRYPSMDGGTLARELGYRAGPCSSGDSLDAPPADLERMQEWGVVAKDMEAAAVAMVAHEMKTPFLAVKSITDLVDGGRHTPTEFLANLQLASRNLAHAIPRVLERLCT